MWSSQARDSLQTRAPRSPRGGKGAHTATGRDIKGPRAAAGSFMTPRDACFRFTDPVHRMHGTPALQDSCTRKTVLSAAFPGEWIPCP